MFLPFFFTSYGRLSSKLYNIRLPALISSILNIVDIVRTVKVYIFTLSVSLMECVYTYIDGLLVLYTVSEVDTNLQNGCLCESACAQNL
jgi:hypothetical protein